MAQRRPQPPPPEPSRFDGRLPAPSSLNPPVPTNVGFVDSSSVEVLDSAMVIRPAIKAVPLALAVKKARGAAVVPPQTPPPIAATTTARGGTGTAAASTTASSRDRR